MITETGGNLSVVIITESDKNWQTFATWYSIYKNWPNAKTSIICNRNGQVPFEYFQWTKRLNIKVLHRNPEKGENKTSMYLNCIKSAIKNKQADLPILLIHPLTMAVDILSQKLIKLLTMDCWLDDDVCYFNKSNINQTIEDFHLSDWKFPEISDAQIEAKDTKELGCLVSYKKGCGRWIHTSKGCPFSSAGGLISEDMNTNEFRINGLWEKMVSLYNSVV